MEIGFAIILIFVVFFIYALFLEIINKINNKKLIQKRAKVVEELSNEIKEREDIFNEIDAFFSKRKKNILLLQLLTNCSGETSLLEEYEKLESEDFNALRKSVVSKLDKKHKHEFPTKIYDIGTFVSDREKEVAEYKRHLGFVSRADNTELNAIIASYCEKLKKDREKRFIKRCFVTFLVSTFFIFLLVVTSQSFALIVAENYHKSVLNEVLKDQGYEYLVVDDIEYEEKKSYYDTEFYYETSVIRLLSNVSNPAEFTNDFNFEEYELGNSMKCNFYYNWAGKKLEFEDKADVLIIITDIDGDEISIN